MYILSSREEAEKQQEAPPILLFVSWLSRFMEPGKSLPADKVSPFVLPFLKVPALNLAGSRRENYDSSSGPGAPLDGIFKRMELFVVLFPIWL